MAQAARLDFDALDVLLVVAVVGDELGAAVGAVHFEGSLRAARLPLVADSWLKLRAGLFRAYLVKLLDACKAENTESILARVYLKPFVIVALNTGMRRGEILGLTRAAVDWQNRMITLGTTKNGDSRHVYLNAAAIEALRSLPARLDTDRMFPFGPNQLSMAFRRAVQRAGIEDFRLHDARHTFASYQAMAGTHGRGLQALLGHKDGRMTMRYSHLSDAYLRDAVNRVNLGPESSGDGTYMAPKAS